MRAVLFLAALAFLLAYSVQGFPAEAQPQTCANSWNGSTVSEKRMFLSGYYTAYSAMALMLGDIGVKGEEQILKQMWPAPSPVDTVLTEMDAYCSSPPNGNRSLAFAVADLARQK